MSSKIRPIDNRILFPGNPWPRGHNIKKFEWSAELTEEGDIWCHLHLESDDYSAEDTDAGNDSESDDTTNWQSKVVWNNYHACILSSTYWDQAGFLIGSGETPLAIESMHEQTFSVDPMPFDVEQDPCFGIYCQGHDTVAGHEITFLRTAEGWTVDWLAMIALTYLGATEFEHQLVARKTGVSFWGVAIAEGISDDEATRLFHSCVANPELFRLTKTKMGRRFLLTKNG